MNLTIQLPPGRDDATALMSHTARRPLTVIRMIGGCYVGLAVLFSVALLPEPPGILGLALVILFFVLMSIFRRRFQASLPSNFDDRGELTITDESLRLVRGPVTTTVRWEAVDSVRPVMHLWAVRYCDQSLIAIPQSAFSPVEDARWREFLRTRGLSGTSVPSVEPTPGGEPAVEARSETPAAAGTPAGTPATAEPQAQPVHRPTPNGPTPNGPAPAPAPRPAAPRTAAHAHPVRVEPPSPVSPAAADPVQGE